MGEVLLPDILGLKVLFERVHVPTYTPQEYTLQVLIYMERFCYDTLCIV